MQRGRLSRWLWLGLILNISIMVWRFWVCTDHVAALLPYRTVTDWISDPDPCIYLIFYGSGFVGIQMAVTGDRRPLLFWNVVYLALLVPFERWSPMSLETLLRYPSNLARTVWVFGAVIATIATYIGHRRMRENRRCGGRLWRVI
jgi:hypothetical protein